MADLRHLQYIDVLKGVVIFLVVVGHAFHFGFSYYQSPLLVVLRSIDMPIFMFLSGLLAARGELSFSLEGCKDFWRKKVRQLFLPLITLPTFYALFYKIPASEMLFGLYHGGYWFTWVLFLIFVLWFAFRLANRFLNPQQDPFVEVFLASLTLVFVLAIDAPWQSASPESYTAMSWGKLNYLYHHFLIGYFVGRYPAFRGFILDPLVTAISAIVFSFLIYMECTHSAVLGGIPASMCGVFLAFGLAHSLGRGASRANRLLAYLGRESRTIYFTHYFFLFSVPFVRGFLLALRNSGARVLGWEVISSCFYAAIVIVLTLVVVRLIKSNPILAWLCYGKSLPRSLNILPRDEQPTDLPNSSSPS